MESFEIDTRILQREFLQAVRDDEDSINPEDYYFTNRGLAHYDSQLPRYNGRTFLEDLRSRIRESDEPIDILDVGCGQGRALGELLREFPGRLRVSGIAAKDLRQYAPDELQPFVEQIDLKVGDAHDLIGAFPTKRFDYIISIHAFQHFVYPGRVAQQCEALLKPRGLAFIEGPHYDRVLSPLPARRSA